MQNCSHINHFQAIYKVSAKSRRYEATIETQEQLRAAFERIPHDPRTESPAGYLGFAQELDCRIHARERDRQRREYARINRVAAPSAFLDSLRQQALASLRE